MAPGAHSSRILEIDLMNAQDLASMSKSMKTYAVAWVEPNPERKLTTGVDQMGHINPTWNDRLMFRMDDKFLNCEDAEIVIEIYTAAWVKDALVGYVRVLLSNLFRLHCNYTPRGDGDYSNFNNSAMRIVSLQVRRPNGHPQGMLNMGVALLDSTMRSMPMTTTTHSHSHFIEDQFTTTTTTTDRNGDGSPNIINNIKKQQKQNSNNNKNPPASSICCCQQSAETTTTRKLNRSQSDRTDLTREEYMRNLGSVVNGGASSSVVAENNKGGGGGGSGSMVNGESLCNSDVGPSASVVAAAIAKGLLRTHPVHQQKPSQITEWTKNEKQEDLSAKLGRWRSSSNIPEGTSSQDKQRRRRRRRKRRDGGGLFSCFGNVFGCQISITCGGKNNKSRRNDKKTFGNVNKNKVCHLSSVEDNYSQSQSYA